MEIPFSLMFKMALERPFNSIYPEGLNHTIAIFEKAFYKIMTTDEIDKIINHSSEDEHKELAELKTWFDENLKDVSWYHCHYVPIAHGINSPTLWRDILCYMIAMDDAPNYKEEEDENS